MCRKLISVILFRIGHCPGALQRVITLSYCLKPFYGSSRIVIFTENLLVCSGYFQLISRILSVLLFEWNT